MIKAVLITETKKCLHCNTYHSQDKQYCPECSRLLYACGDIYQAKVINHRVNRKRGC